MARLDVHPMAGKRAGYIVDVQADLLSDISTWVVVPPLPEEWRSRSVSSVRIFPARTEARRCVADRAPRPYRTSAARSAHRFRGNLARCLASARLPTAK